MDHLSIWYGTSTNNNIRNGFSGIYSQRFNWTLNKRLNDYYEIKQIGRDKSVANTKIRNSSSKSQFIDYIQVGDVTWKHLEESNCKMNGKCSVIAKCKGSWFLDNQKYKYFLQYCRQCHLCISCAHFLPWLMGQFTGVEL